MMTINRPLQQNRIGRDTRSLRSGFSMVEIMVVMVVLLIGILAVVRLFPAGFLSIARTSELTTADALNKQQLDQMRADLSPPEAILAEMPGVSAYDTYNVLPSSLLDRVPGDPYLLVNGNNLDPWYFSNVNMIRNIMGETNRVPVPTTNTGDGTTGISFGAIYPLQFGPVENSLNGVTDSILVYGQTMQRTEQSSIANLNNVNGTATLRNESEYAIDYDNLKIAFFPRLIDLTRPVQNRQFTISYDYYVLNGTTIGLQFQPNVFNGGASTVITVNDVSPNADGSFPAPIWQPLFQSTVAQPMYPTDPNNLNGMMLPTTPLMYLGPLGAFPPAANTLFPYGISHESEDVSRKFRLALALSTVAAGGVPLWSKNDPYEYAWYSQQNPGNTVNPGILIFNPSGHNQPQVNSAGTQPLTFRVDYRTFDNHIIRDDRSVPSSSPYTIALSVPFLKLGGDILDSQNALNTFNPALNPYNGIFRDAANTTPDIMIFNMNTGQEVGDWTNQNAIPGTNALAIDPVNDPTPVDQKTGIITLNPTYINTNNLASASLRIFYRTTKDWGMQVQKAAAHYKEASIPANVDFRHYFIGDGTTGSATRIYFAPCDAGKSVIIGEFYINPPTPPSTTSTGPYRSQTFQITENPQQFDLVVPGQPKLPYIDITTVLGANNGITGFSATQTGRRVNNVQGCSIKSRVIWEDASRWRVIDNDTILVQAPSQ